LISHIAFPTIPPRLVFVLASPLECKAFKPRKSGSDSVKSRFLEGTALLLPAGNEMRKITKLDGFRADVKARLIAESFTETDDEGGGEGLYEADFIDGICDLETESEGS
jgi:hypothetical protein